MIFPIVYKPQCGRWFPSLPLSSPDGIYAEAYINNTCILTSVTDQYMDFGAKDCLPGSSLASQIAKNLIQADIVTMFSNPIWNSSWIVSNGSFLGQFLMNVFGYNASPSGLELSFYFTTLVVLIVLKREVNVRAARTHKING